MKTVKNYDNFLFEKNNKNTQNYNCEDPDPNYRNECVDFDYLLGRTFTTINVDKDGDSIEFLEDNGNVFNMEHRQDCCEEVYIEDIDGDINDLIGNPILRAEESSNEDGSIEGKDVDEHNSYTWTFYKLATIKGSLTIRWFGQSNGYYSQKAYIYVIKDNENGVDNTY